MSFLLATLAAVVLFALLVIAAVVYFPFFLQWLAEENILFTTVKEGTVKAIMRGRSFDRFVMAFAGYHLNDPTRSWYDKNHPKWEVIYHADKEKDGGYDDRNPLLKHLGLHWVGWPWANSVYVYAFEWNETSTDREGKEKVLPRSEATDFIYVADFTYAIVTESAETKDRLPTDELTLVTAAIRNPYRALFSGEDWMRRTTAAINRHVRNFVGTKNFEALISASNSTEFSAPIILLNKMLPDDDEAKPPCGLQGRYGVEIRTADLQTIELSGDAKRQHQEATTRQYTAEQDAKATILTGEATAKVIRLTGEAEADALAKRLAIIEKHGSAGEALAGYDAIRESSKGPGNTVIWANNPLTPLTEMLKSAKEKGGER
jgi:hypothetical protein